MVGGDSGVADHDPLRADHDLRVSNLSRSHRRSHRLMGNASDTSHAQLDRAVTLHAGAYHYARRCAIHTHLALGTLRPHRSLASGVAHR